MRLRPEPGLPHLRTLRNADLAASRRDGKLVIYRLTPTGHALLTTLIGAETLTQVS
jgi:DNA-binding transcriptional ArsR family regulator